MVCISTLYIWYVLYVLTGIRLYLYVSMHIGMYNMYWYVIVCFVCNDLH